MVAYLLYLCLLTAVVAVMDPRYVASGGTFTLLINSSARADDGLPWMVRWLVRVYRTINSDQYCRQRPTTRGVSSSP